MRRITSLFLISAIWLPVAAFSAPPDSNDTKPVRVAIAGLVHGHVDGFLRLARSHPEIQVVGLFDPDTSLHARYAQKFGLPASLFFTDLATMLDRVKPEAVATFTDTYDHPVVVGA